MVSVQIRTVITALDQFIELVMKRIVLDVVANLVRAPARGGTPVDTGWARANWVPRIGQPVTATDGSRESVSQGAQQSGLAAVATGYKLVRGPVWISNNVPYILQLNDGSSQQAPAGFVQAAIGEAVLSAARVRGRQR